MRITARQTATRTTADLCRAHDRRHPVTITYTKASGEQTVRTIEIHEMRTTSAGDLIAVAMDRQSGESRTWRIDRITAYTVHRSAAYQMPEPEKTGIPGLWIIHTPQDLIDQELARDAAQEDRAYWDDLYADAEPDTDRTTA